MQNISEAENSYLSNRYNVDSSKNNSEKRTKNNIEETQQNNDSDKKNQKQQKILSTNETTTLHMLFGSSKPEEMKFYTRNKIDQISKGHLLDLKG